MRADIHDGQERERSTQGPDTEAQDQQSPDHHSGLQRTAGPYRCARTGREQSQQSSPLFDHLVGALLKKPRHVDLQCLRGFHIQNKFELRW
jgi:hypothetical protein